MASNARWYPHRAFCKIQPCCILQKLVGERPKPFNDFFKIGCAPAELSSWKFCKGLQNFLDSLIDFFLVLFDFRKLSFVEIASLVDTLGNLIFAV